MKLVKMLLLCALFYTNVLSAQIIKLDDTYKINNAELIVEGTILDQHAIAQNNSIFTYYKMAVQTVFKGQSIPLEIEVQSEGGVVGDKALKTFPSNDFRIGDYGIYFLNKNPNQSYYTVAFFAQSELKLKEQLTQDQRNSIFSDVSVISTISQQINQFTQSTNQRNITNISPTTVNAGIGDTVTITGTGFGASGPTTSMMVWTVFSDNPSTRISFPDSYNYVSWSDTEIVFRVPTGAATGTIRVGDATTYVESATVLQVNYNVKDYATYDGSAIYPINLPVLQDQGISFVPNTNFTNTDAINRTKEAMDQWVCSSNMNWIFDENSPTSNMHDSSDGLSVIYFDSTLASQTLGVTKTGFSACSYTGRWFITDVDIAMNASSNFNFTSGATTSSQYDFYSVMLHELGHARNLGHTANSVDVMYPYIAQGVDNRILQTNDIDGGLWVQNDSNTNQVCSSTLMTNGTCANLSTVAFQDATFSLYPNPATDLIEVNTIENATYTIYNFDGKLLKTGELTSNSQVVDVSNFKSGLYFIKLDFSNNITQNTKFFKK